VRRVCFQRGDELAGKSVDLRPIGARTAVHQLTQNTLNHDGTLFTDERCKGEEQEDLVR